ncbi:MAG: hypothetical protein AB1730_23700 [Myxococcota bacterium]|jgi:hypothetical protein
MRRHLAILVFALSVLSGATAFAAGGRKVQEFQEVEMTDEEREQAQNRGRHRVSRWQEEKQLPPETPFPWMFVGLCAAVLALAAPFAWGAYKRTSDELKEASAFGPQTPRRTRTRD